MTAHSKLLAVVSRGGKLVARVTLPDDATKFFNGVGEFSVAAGPSQIAEVEFSAAEMAAGVHKTLVAAPGENRVIWPLNYVSVFKPGMVAYDGGTSSYSLGWMQDYLAANQTITPDHPAESGDLSISYDGHNVTVSFDATASDLQAALRAIDGLESVTVEGDLIGGEEGGFLVHFTGVEFPAILVDDGSSLIGDGPVSITINPVDHSTDSYVETISPVDISIAPEAGPALRMIQGDDQIVVGLDEYADCAIVMRPTDPDNPPSGGDGTFILQLAYRVVDFSEFLSE